MSHAILAVYAHPDDEAFGAGGALARYADAGHGVHLICATRGESGKITDPDIDPDADRAALREAELRAACAELGIQPPILLDYHDSGRQERTRFDDPKALMNVGEGELERALLPHFARLKPTVVLTFDPHGIYGHIDHVKIHRAATAAFWSAGGVATPAPRRLFYSAMGAERMRRMQEARPQSALAELDPDLYGVSEDSFAAVLDVRPWAERKERAVRAHRSQVGPNSNFRLDDAPAGEPAWQDTFARETFTLGGLRGGFPPSPVDDLLAGLDAG